MTDDSRNYELEKDLSAVYASAPSEDFVSILQAQLTHKAQEQKQRFARPFYLRPVWLATSLVLLALLITFFAIGPSRVVAAFQKLLGYVPGTGLVSTDTPLRVLAEPVEQTRDGVTLTVTSALLSAESTHIEYRVFGIPRDAYPDSEAISGCMQQEYLRLPDGSKLERMNDYPAIFADVNEAVLVVPCLANTLPGKAPENWELPLRFVPAPEGFMVLPVEEITPAIAAETATQLPVEAQTPTPDASAGSVTVTKVIDTENGFILIVSFLPGGGNNAWVQQSGMPTITDEAGKNVAYSIPLDIQNSLQADPSGADVMAYQFNASGVAFPMTIHYRGVRISVPQPDARASFTFDAGAAPQPGQEWKIDQPIELAGHTLTLVSVDADSRGGYSFHFKTDVNVNGVGVSIEGYQPNGGGGGGGGGMTNGEINVSISYSVLPKGTLTVVLSSLSEITGELEWTTQWSPTMIRTDIPSTPQLADGVCADAATIANLASLPAGIQGKGLFGETSVDGSTSLVLASLDGSGKVVLSPEIGWETLSGNGKKIVYSSLEGFVLYDITSASTTQLNLGGYNPRLSSDGTKLAYVEVAAAGIDVYDIQTRTNRQVSNQAYSSVVGWSADDTRLYIAVMAAGGSAWQIQSIDVNSGAAQALFIIENGSYKALNAALSPDGQWVAYRGRGNSSVYLAHIDGSETRLLLDNPSIGISGITWASNGWLGVSLMNADNSQNVIMVDPESCQAWVLPQLNGTIQGLIIN